MAFMIVRMRGIKQPEMDRSVLVETDLVTMDGTVVRTGVDLGIDIVESEFRKRSVFNPSDYFLFDENSLPSEYSLKALLNTGFSEDVCNGLYANIITYIRSKQDILREKMKQNVFKIGGTEVPKGSVRNIAIELPKLYHLPASIPIHVIRGRREGPTVFVSAAIHGDELNGIEIIRRLKNLSVVKKLRGTLILVPVVNVYGLNTLSRYLPDRRDLNRSFPGSSKGSLATRIAKIFFDEIVRKSDYGIDLHTGAIHRSNLPQIRTNTKNEETLRLAKAFEAPVVLHSELRDDSLRAEAQECGVPVLLYEAGEALRFDETSIKIGVKGIVNVLKALQMLPETKKRRHKHPLIFKESSWIRAHESGMLRTVKALGDSVKKGDVIAFIDEPLGENRFALHSAFDGIIIGKSQIPLVQEGDAVFHIARSSNLDTAEERIGYFQEDAIVRSDIYGLNEEHVIE